MNFSDNLEKLIKERKASKKELAETVGITTQAFYDWKKRNSFPSADIALKIAKYLNTTVEYLLTGTNENPLQAENERLKNKINAIMGICTQDEV